MAKPLKIGIDLDGTAWRHREFFKEFCWAMKERGHSIGIVTAHHEGLIIPDLFLWEKRGFPKPDFMVYMDNPKDLIGDFKRDAVELENLDVLIDDLGGDNQGIKETFFNRGELDFLFLQVYPGEE